MPATSPVRYGELMIVSDRLMAAAGLVTAGSRLADIGTDHGYVPILLVQQGRIPSAVAMDINEGPIARAQLDIRRAGLCAEIQTRRSDGLEKLRENEADTVLIAGMGGALTIRILENGASTLHGGSVRELVLQPQSEIGKVRRWLQKNGWRIDLEDMVLEDGKYYPMMQCHEGMMELTDLEAQYGPRLLGEHHPVLVHFLKRERSILEKSARGAEKAEGDRGEERRRQVAALLERNRQACLFAERHQA